MNVCARRLFAGLEQIPLATIRVQRLLARSSNLRQRIFTFSVHSWRSNNPRHHCPKTAPGPFPPFLTKINPCSNDLTSPLNLVLQWICHAATNLGGNRTYSAHCTFSHGATVLVAGYDPSLQCSALYRTFWSFCFNPLSPCLVILMASGFDLKPSQIGPTLRTVYQDRQGIAK